MEIVFFTFPLYYIRFSVKVKNEYFFQGNPCVTEGIILPKSMPIVLKMIKILRVPVENCDFDIETIIETINGITEALTAVS